MVDDAGHSAKEHGIRKLLVEVSLSPPSVAGLSFPSFYPFIPRHPQDLGLVLPVLVRLTQASNQTSPVGKY